MSVQLKGKEHTWSFSFYGDPKDIEDWREDGLDVTIIENAIPEWAVNCGLTHVYAFFQDIFNFKRPFGD